ncbi:hypothetical protein VTN00DRAFT_7140 [Thermoascus crustaceus]|uniref:uncharacterized protein n=1 Tax=Thermoascus crustaceus TaxID=5088 RepID=UPI003741F6D1
MGALLQSEARHQVARCDPRRKEWQVGTGCASEFRCSSLSQGNLLPSNELVPAARCCTCDNATTVSSISAVSASMASSFLIARPSVLPLGSKLSLCGVWGGHTPIQSRYASHDSAARIYQNGSRPQHASPDSRCSLSPWVFSAGLARAPRPAISSQVLDSTPEWVTGHGRDLDKRKSWAFLLPVLVG